MGIIENRLSSVQLALGVIKHGNCSKIQSENVDIDNKRRDSRESD